MSKNNDDILDVFDEVLKIYHKPEDILQGLSQSTKSQLAKCDWGKFFEMYLDSTSEITFPCKIHSDYHKSLSQEEIDMINSDYINKPTFIEQELARRDGEDGCLDIEGYHCRRDYDEEFEQTHTFTFREFYKDIYEALKELDRIMGTTDFAVLFIESVMNCGLGKWARSEHPIINAAMAGVKFHIDRDLETKRNWINKKIERSQKKECCKSSLKELLADNNYEQSHILKDM